MDSWISLLPQIILAQALGVALAWGVDAVTWKWRRVDEMGGEPALWNAILALLFLMPPVAILLTGSSLAEHLDVIAKFILAPLIFWLLLVAWVQGRQHATSWRATFGGVLMQFICFVATLLMGASLIFLLSVLRANFVFNFVWFVSASLTYALLSLFRPTIYSAWNTARENGKNRRVR